MRFIQTAVPALAGVLALAPAGAFAVDYLTADQAAKQLFAEADRFELREWILDAAQLQQLSQMGVKPRSARWVLRLAWRGKDLLGAVVIDEVLGKFELITYAVAQSLDGKLRGIEVLSYRESHGQEIRLPAWRRQFVGKSVEAPIKLGDDIASISGATLSCSHVTEGVKRITAMLDLARRAGVLS